MPLDTGRLDSPLALVRRHYPDWDNFDHTPFTQDEIAYKRQAALLDARQRGTNSCLTPTR